MTEDWQTFDEPTAHRIWERAIRHADEERWALAGRLDDLGYTTATLYRTADEIGVPRWAVSKAIAEERAGEERAGAPSHVRCRRRVSRPPDVVRGQVRRELTRRHHRLVASHEGTDRWETGGGWWPDVHRVVGRVRLVTSTVPASGGTDLAIDVDLGYLRSSHTLLALAGALFTLGFVAGTLATPLAVILSVLGAAASVSLAAIGYRRRIESIAARVEELLDELAEPPRPHAVI